MQAELESVKTKCENSQSCPTNEPNYHLLYNALGLIIGHHLINDRCIFVEEKQLNYEDAKQNCKEKFGGNGKLFEPRTWAENVMVYKVTAGACRRELNKKS